MGYKHYNANPENKRVGDCTVRALSLALGQSWEQTYIDTALAGLLLLDMPTANHVWGAYLRRKGWARHTLPDECPDCYTVADFAQDHPQGAYILALASHVVCLKDGDWYDSWNSGSETPLYFWKKESED